jgi:hypothetical protein
MDYIIRCGHYNQRVFAGTCIFDSGVLFARRPDSAKSNMLPVFLQRSKRYLARVLRGFFTEETRKPRTRGMKGGSDQSVALYAHTFNVRVALMVFYRSILSLLLFSLSAGASNAQDRLAYADRGNRFEGHRRVEVAAPAFEALSFVRGEPIASRSSPTTLRANFYLPKAKPIYIKARELVAVHFYEMAAKRTDWPVGANTFGPWRTSDVIDELGVSLSNIGVLARVGNKRAGTGGEIAALSFSEASSRSSVYEFIFRVKYDVKKATYRVEHISSGIQAASGLHNQVTGGAPVSIRFDLSNAVEGQYLLVLDCLYKGRSGGPQRIFEFYHKP